MESKVINKNDLSFKTSSKVKYNAQNIALIAVLTSLVMALKYAFGFISGVEVVTLLFCIYALFTPLIVSGTTTIAFILLCAAIYGVGPWWIMYWFIWPTEVLLTWAFKKFLKKNNVIFGLWAGFWGFSLILWYAAQDYIMFDKSYMIAQMSTGIFANSIEGVTNLILGLLVFYPAKKVFGEKLNLGNSNYW